MRSLPWSVVATGCLLACGGGGSDDGGGDDSSSDDLGSDECLEARPCGGDVVGNWQAQEVCYPDGRPRWDATFCVGGTIEVIEIEPSGVLTFEPDGSFLHSLESTMTHRMSLPLDCFGGSTQSCEQYGRDIDDAMCAAPVNTCLCDQVIETSVPGAGTYVTSGETITFVGGGLGGMENYCVDGDALYLFSESHGVAVVERFARPP